jgi:uncharacterized protein (TIGR02271 family)
MYLIKTKVMATNDYRDDRLQELGGSGYEIVDDEPNIKGWDVRDASGQKIGKVDELIFDKQSQKVRYVVVDLKGKLFDMKDHDVLVPIGLTELDEKDDDVILSNITSEELRLLPVYEEGTVDADMESRIRNVLSGIGSGMRGTASAPSTSATDAYDEEFYNHEHFNEENIYRNRRKAGKEAASIPVIEESLQVGKREVEKGGIRLRSRIVEEEVNKDVNLRDEKVRVERRPVDRPATEGDIHEKNIEISETAEVPVVSKTARVVEEVSLDKEVKQRNETVSDTVRKTEVDIEKTDTEEDLNTGTNRT